MIPLPNWLLFQQRMVELIGAEHCHPAMLDPKVTIPAQGQSAMWWGADGKVHVYPTTDLTQALMPDAPPAPPEEKAV